MKTPYYKLYPEDFMTGVSDMGLTQRGAYISMLNYQWIKGPLPSDKSTLYRMVGAMTEDEQTAVNIVLDKKFTLIEDGWVNIRLKEVHIEATAFMLKQHQNGSKGGRPKGSGGKPKKNPTVSSGKTQTDSQKETQSETQKKACHSSYSLSNTDSNTDSKPKRPQLKKWWPEFFFTENDEFQEAWNEWKQKVRDKKGCSNSDRAVKKQLNRVLEFCSGNVQTAIDVVNQSSDKGWTEVYELQSSSKPKPNDKFLWEQE